MRTSEDVYFESLVCSSWQFWRRTLWMWTDKTRFADEKKISLNHKLVSSEFVMFEIYNIMYIEENEIAYILESLLGAPPVTLATRRRASSALRSFNWANKSALVLPLNSWTLIRAVFHATIWNKSDDIIQTKSKYSSDHRNAKVTHLIKCNQSRCKLQWRVEAASETLDTENGRNLRV